MSNKNDTTPTIRAQTPNQPNLELTNTIGNLSNSTNNHDYLSKDIQPNLREANMIAGISSDDELNSEFSPQHQLFNEGLIRRISQSNVDNNHHQHRGHLDNIETVINLNDLSSDIDDEVEIDPLANSSDEILDTSSSNSIVRGQQQYITTNLSNYKIRYRNLVHAIKKLIQNHGEEKTHLENLITNLTKQLDSIGRESSQQKQLNVSNNNNSTTISASSSQSDNIDKTILNDARANSQQIIANVSSISSSSKQSKKIKDLDKLLAKCKESLKAKNFQLKILKDSLVKVDQFRDMMDVVKCDLNELKQAYETWTLSIAENKRVMHQEIEDKISEMEKYKAELKELQLQIKEQSSKMNNLKSTIQNLESRLVSTSAAHQKERESLIREMNAAKNNALRQQQRENDLQTERIKLELEKSIEALKSELLVKDEQIIRNAENQQKLHEQNQQYAKDLNETRQKLEDTIGAFDQIKSQSESQNQRVSLLEAELEKTKNETNIEHDLEEELENYKSKLAETEKNCSSFESKCHDYEQESTKLKEFIKDLEQNLNEFECLKAKLMEEKEKNSKLEEINSNLNDQSAQSNKKVVEIKEQLLKVQQELNEERAKDRLLEAENCKDCQELSVKIAKAAEEYEQDLHELKGRLDLMTTANTDQEKAIIELENNYNGSMTNLQAVKIDFEESIKKNESLLQVIQDNDVEIQQQQEQINQLMLVKQELDNLKRENSNLSTNLDQLKQDLLDRHSELNQSRSENDELSSKLMSLNVQLKFQIQSVETLKAEKDLFSLELTNQLKKRNEFDQQLVVSILSAMKNLESPDTSPGSEKILKNSDEQSEKSFEDNGDWSQDEHSDTQSLQNTNLPDPIRLAKELSSLALNRSSAYVNVTQRLEAVLLDNKMINDELRRLRDELSSLNQEKSQEVQCSLEEVERLRTENQALIHDQKAYDDQVASLENAIDTLTEQLNSNKQKLQDFPQVQPVTEKRDIGIETLVNEEQDDLEARYNELDELLKSKEDEIKQLKESILEKANLDQSEKLIMQSEHQEQSNQQQQQQQQIIITQDAYVPDATEFEYLKNIVCQFMMGREPVTLARVISAVFKFDKSQVDQICKVQEAIHQVNS